MDYIVDFNFFPIKTRYSYKVEMFGDLFKYRNVHYLEFVLETIKESVKFL